MGERRRHMLSDETFYKFALKRLGVHSNGRKHVPENRNEPYMPEWKVTMTSPVR